MRRIRADGFCVATGEVDAGRIGIAVPIILPHRKQVASLSVVLEREPGDVDGIVTRFRAERHAIEMALSSDGGDHNET
jgi:DNA-binding IclR family transcriptional regulator